MAARGASLAARFLSRFAGLERAHGIHIPSHQTTKANGKLQGGNSTESGPPTVELWETHLAGKQGLGVHMLRDNGTVRFAAIDIDLYPLPHDHAALARSIAELELPLIVCASKSGGAHLYLFGAEDLPGTLVRKKLAEWAIALKLPDWGTVTEKGRTVQKWEYYPKKDRLSGPTDHGNYLNMPYYGTERQAMGLGGKWLTAEQFLKLADSKAVTIKELQALSMTPEVAMVDGPPCLQALLREGPVSEYRNQTMLNLGVYVRMRFPDEWEDKFDEYHRQFIAEQLPTREASKVLKSVGKKDYNYSCSQEPIVSRCNKDVCLTRKFGVRARAVENAGGEGGGFSLNLGQLTKFDSDPPTWELDVDGFTLRLTTDQLASPGLFRKQAMEKLNKPPPILTNAKWQAILEDRFATLKIVPAPTESGESGVWWWHLEQYCANFPAQTRDDMKDGRVWLDEGRVYFQLIPFWEYLKRHKIFLEPRQLSSQFRAWKCNHGQFNLKGKCVQWWSMKEPNRQTEPDDAPKIMGPVDEI